MSLVFYDTETTGTDTFFDQILQFAAIRTDEALNEVDRFEVRCRLLPYVVPAPAAVLVNGIKVSELTDSSLPSHYEMIRCTHERLQSWSPALFIGWNSIQFDENLVRQAFYKTLHTPYLTNSDGNARSDAMRIAQACSLFAPGAVSFPTDEAGQKIFKLDEMALANGFKYGRRHEAVSDVEATVFLCRLIAEKSPEVWSAFMRLGTKAAVADYISEERLFCFCDFYYGQAFSCIATAVGQNQSNTAEWYIYNLGVDPGTLSSLSDSQLAARLRQLPKPLRRLKSNGAPMLFPVDQAPEFCKGRDLAAEELDRRAELLHGTDTLGERLVQAFESCNEPYPISVHVEKQIYNSFFQESDEKLMDAFHEAEWSERPSIVEKFEDDRLRSIGRLLLYVERPDLLDKATRRNLDAVIVKRLLGKGGDVLWLTLPEAITQIEKEILPTTSGPELKLLRDHHVYLRARYKQALRDENDQLINE